jgi:hypothetical protein
VKWESDMGTAGLVTLNHTEMLMYGLIDLLESLFGDIVFRGVPLVKLGTVRLRLTQQRFRARHPATGAAALQEAAEAIQNHLISHATEGQLFRVSQDHQGTTAPPRHQASHAQQPFGGGRQTAPDRVPEHEKDFCISHDICLRWYKASVGPGGNPYNSACGHRSPCRTGGQGKRGWFPPRQPCQPNGCDKGQLLQAL